MEGNQMKMRETLEKLRSEIGRFCYNDWIPYDVWQECDDVISHALSSSPRNCDVGTAEEQAQRYDQFCEENECSMCPVHAKWRQHFDVCKHEHISCGLIWAQMPYGAHEGGAK